MSLRKLNPTEAGVVGLFTTLVGQIVAWVPQFATEQATVIAGGTALISAVFVFIHGFSDFGDVVADARTGKVKVTFQELEDDIRAAADDEISKVKNVNPADVAKIAEEVIDGKVHVPSLSDIEKIAEAKLEQLLSGGVSLKVAPPVVAPAPAIPQPAPPPVA